MMASRRGVANQPELSLSFRRSQFIVNIRISGLRHAVVYILLFSYCRIRELEQRLMSINLADSKNRKSQAYALF